MELSREELFDINMMITMSVTVGGNAARNQLEAAFANTIASCVGLNTRIVIDENGAAWYEPYEQSENSLHFTEQSLEELIHEQERKRFRLENGEYLRLFVNDYESGTLRLHFFLHHTAGDGKSLCYIIESFLRSLNGEDLPKKPITILKRDQLPKDSRMKLLYRCYAESWNRRWRKQNRVFDFRDMDRAYEQFWKMHETEILLTSVDSDVLQTQKEACRGITAGFTSRYIAGLLKDVTSGKNKDTGVVPQRIGLAVSIRNEGDRSTGNMVTGVTIQHRYESSSGFSGNAEEIDRKLRAAIADPKQKYFVLHFLSSFTPSLLDAAILEHYGAFHSSLSGKLADVLHYGQNSKPLNDVNITNLGNLDIPTEYGDFRIDDLIFIPPNVCYAEDVLGLVSVRGRLNIARRRYKKTKPIAVITGASGGLGRAFVRQVTGEVDEIWAIGRNMEKLNQLVKEYGGLSGLDQNKSATGRNERVQGKISTSCRT